MRESTGLSQGEFSATLGLSHRAFANYERGEREAPMAVFRGLYELYGIDPGWLLSGIEGVPVKASTKEIDFALVERIITQIDTKLKERSKKLKPKQRILVLKALYAIAVDQGKTCDADVDRILAVAASR